MPIPVFKELRIENTNACGYKCVMCPREKQTRKIGYMPLGDLVLAMDRIGPFEGNIHLHGFGEPLLDRSLTNKIRLLHEKYPTSRSIIFSTLGVRMDEERLRELAFSGLGRLYVSLYGFTADGYAKVHGFNGFELVKRNLLTLSQAMKDKSSPLKIHVKVPSPHAATALPMADLSEGVSFCRWVEGLGFEVAVWPSVHNFGDGRNYNSPDQDRLCPVIQGMRRYFEYHLGSQRHSLLLRLQCHHPVRQLAPSDPGRDFFKPRIPPILPRPSVGGPYGLSRLSKLRKK